jgi:hypothetical protein
MILPGEEGGEVAALALGDDGARAASVDGVMVAQQVTWLSVLW